MELSAWPQSSLNADEITDERIKEIRADLDSSRHRDLRAGLLPQLSGGRPGEAADTNATSAR